MPAGNDAAAIAAQIEAIRPKLETIVLFSSVLWGRIDARTDLTPVSSRPTRVPIQAISGGQFRTMNPDGGDNGRGSGPQETPGYLACSYYLQASEYTAQAEWATDGSAKSIQNYVTLTHEQAAETFGGYKDVLAQGDGSNTIDTIVTVVAGGFVVNNANFFQSNQLVDIWTAVGGAFVATVQIQIEDINSNTIWLTGPVPAGVTAGMPLLVSGSSGQANTGIFGLKYYNVGLNVGNFMGIQRASYPGRFIAQNVNLGGGSLTPAAVRAVQAAVVLAMGQKVAAATDPVAHCNVDMQVAWENCALPVQSIIFNEQKGDESMDMLKKNPSSSMAGRPMLINPRGTPGRVDLVDLKEWWRIETKPTDYYDVGGQTVFPVIANSGGLASANLFYLVSGDNIGVNSVRNSAFLSNVAIPRFLLGH